MTRFRDFQVCEIPPLAPCTYTISTLAPALETFQPMGAPGSIEVRGVSHDTSFPEKMTLPSAVRRPQKNPKTPTVRSEGLQFLPEAQCTPAARRTGGAHVRVTVLLQ